MSNISVNPLSGLVGKGNVLEDYDNYLEYQD